MARIPRFFDYEYRPDEGLVLKFKIPKGKSIPTEAKAHGAAAIKEGLLAARGLLDAVIEAMEEVEKSPSKKTRSKIKVE